MINSILTSTKKTLGIAEEYTVFDEDILMHINTTLSTLNQMGVGPVEGFLVEDAAATWQQFVGVDPRFNSVRTYVFLSVKRVFDPPTTSFHLDAVNKQIEELGWRLNVEREAAAWVPTEPVIDGGTSSTMYDEE